MTVKIKHSVPLVLVLPQFHAKGVGEVRQRVGMIAPNSRPVFAADDWTVGRQETTQVGGTAVKLGLLKKEVLFENIASQKSFLRYLHNGKKVVEKVEY